VEITVQTATLRYTTTFFANSIKGHTEVIHSINTGTIWLRNVLCWNWNQNSIPSR